MSSSLKQKFVQTSSKFPYIQLDGIYTRVWRNSKFKTKGIMLRVEERELAIAFPKELRILMLNEIQPGDRLRILAKQKQEKTIAVNVMVIALDDRADDRVYHSVAATPTLDPTTVIPLDIAGTVSNRETSVIEVCRKGTCRKRGSLALFEQWQQERVHDPNLADIKCQLTGCLKRCKAGVNVRIGDRVISHAQNLSLSGVLAADISA